MCAALSEKEERIMLRWFDGAPANRGTEEFTNLPQLSLYIPCRSLVIY